jgi:hypothetical protein
MKDESAKRGECRLNPPAVIEITKEGMDIGGSLEGKERQMQGESPPIIAYTGSYTDGYWPITGADDWCGQFKAKKGATSYVAPVSVGSKRRAF